jgi:hypothetical protein
MAAYLIACISVVSGGLPRFSSATDSRLVVDPGPVTVMIAVSVELTHDRHLSPAAAGARHGSGVSVRRIERQM